MQKKTKKVVAPKKSQKAVKKTTVKKPVKALYSKDGVTIRSGKNGSVEIKIVG